MEKRFFSVREAAKYSSLSARLLYQACQNRELRFSRVGRRIIIGSKDLHDFITKHTIEPINWDERAREINR